VCEYCGCQDIDVIAELTSEHDRLRELGRTLQDAARAGDVAGAREVAAAMRSVLGPHTNVEEIGLFPMLAGAFPAELDALVGEHRTIDATLEQLAEGPVPGDWQTRISAALAQLFEHILKEQDGVFPAALGTLSAREWEALEAIRDRVESGSVPTGR
jgi:hemerythrin-like domain-containing protein